MTLSDALMIMAIALNIVAVIAILFARRAIDKVLSSRASRFSDAASARSSSLSLLPFSGHAKYESVIIPSSRKCGDADR